jgi:hypothetical protein
MGSECEKGGEGIIWSGEGGGRNEWERMQQRRRNSNYQSPWLR